jgi:hypothetical protein
MHLFLGALCIILLLPNLFAIYDHFSYHPVLLFAPTSYSYLTFPSSSVLNFLIILILHHHLKKKKKKGRSLPFYRLVRCCTHATINCKSLPGVYLASRLFTS